MLAPLFDWLLAVSPVPLYVVGGVVRDALLRGLPEALNAQCLVAPGHTDWDLVCEGPALSIFDEATFTKAGLSAWQWEATYPATGTLTLRHAETGIAVDIASTRVEMYPAPGAMPCVTAFGVPLERDVTRRDFTINTLAIPLASWMGAARPKVLDFTGGQRDLQARHLRTLHARSFWDDPSRVLRALKFATRLDFTLAEATEDEARALCADAHTGFAGGGDRIRDELLEWLCLPASPTQARWLAWFDAQQGHWLLGSGHPPLTACAPLASPLPCFEQPPPPTCLPWLPPLVWLLRHQPLEAVSAAANQLGLLRAQRHALVEGVALCQDVQRMDALLATETTLAQQLIFFDNVPLDAWWAAFQSCSVPEAVQKAHWDTYQRYKRYQPWLSGDDLLAAGLPAGPVIKQVLLALRLAVLSGQLHYPEEARAWLTQFIEK
jgi:tRNA nucleotidyltransferase/poly(A) polymerase